MGETKIEWADVVWNPTRGCSLVSAGCTNCYAMRQAHRFSGEGMPYGGLTRLTSNGPVWTGEVRLAEEALDLPLRWKKPRRIFVNSMSDLFHENLTDESIDRVFAVMALCPQHTFQVLTKRAERMHDYINGLSMDRLENGMGFAVESPVNRRLSPNLHEMYLGKSTRFWRQVYIDATDRGLPLKNCWLGVSVEDQKTADERIPWLLKTPATVRWVSYEPALGPVDFLYPATLWPDGPPMCCNGRDCGCRGLPIDPPLVCEMNGAHVNWIVFGGESGPCSRPCNTEWALSVLTQRRTGYFKVFVKQLGAKPYGRPMDQLGRILKDKKGGDINEWPEDLRVREFPEVAR